MRFQPATSTQSRLTESAGNPRRSLPACGRSVTRGLPNALTICQHTHYA
jgi:hypothetical protein